METVLLVINESDLFLSSLLAYSYPLLLTANERSEDTVDGIEENGMRYDKRSR